MKILMISEAYPPLIDGVAIHVQSLSRQLSIRGHKVSVCTIEQRGLLRYEEEGDLKIYRLQGFFQKIPGLYQDHTKKGHPPVRDWLISRGLARIIEKESPDIIHAHGWILYSALPLTGNAKIPIVCSLHDHRLFCPKMIPMKQNVTCDDGLTKDCIFCLRPICGLLRAFPAYFGLKRNTNTLKSVDKFIALNPQVKEAHMKHLGISRREIEVIPNFCDPVTGSDRKGCEELPDEFVMFAGRLTPEKGIAVLIEAYQRLNLDVKLLIIGKERPGYYYQSTGNILIAKNVAHNIVMQVMSKCKFVVIPSTCLETCPTVALEAMSQRKAVVASNIGGLKGIVVDRETGILVPHNDPIALSDAILYLLERPEVASRMGERGYSIFLKNYAPDVVIPKVIEIYDSLISS